MFTKEICGLANGLVGGWGNVGGKSSMYMHMMCASLSSSCLIHMTPHNSYHLNLGGATQLVMGTALFPLFKLIWGGNETMAWRTVTIVPAVVAFSTGVIVILTSDDCPKGKYKDLKKSGEMPEISAAASFVVVPLISIPGYSSFSMPVALGLN